MKINIWFGSFNYSYRIESLELLPPLKDFTKIFPAHFYHCQVTSPFVRQTLTSENRIFSVKHYLFPVDDSLTNSLLVMGTTFWINTCWSSRSPKGPWSESRKHWYKCKLMFLQFFRFLMPGTKVLNNYVNATPFSYTMLCINYISIKLGKKICCQNCKLSVPSQWVLRATVKTDNT